MALTGKTNKFEEGGEDNGNTVVEEQAETTTTAKLSADDRIAMAQAKAGAKPADTKDAAPAAASTERAVATPAKTSSLAVSMTKANPFTALENAITVDYNTLTRLMCTNGNYVNKENDAILGDTIGLELISKQKSFVLSPGGDSDDQESLAYVKYSKDGETTDDGESMQECLAIAKQAGYTKAKIAERLILVGCLFDPGKQGGMKNDLVQIDLAPLSKDNFKRHEIAVAFGISRGNLPREGAERLKMTCDLKSNTIGNKKVNWTNANFAHYPL